ncbi:right-handed parallel beta-helix repeat-containing protein [Pseudocolwellia sp. HL-MZ19]|uniref:right-handed parallel beta-helix repeat-containing protein n=1 Tax=unclassified Pseudocolwellia TaxID=2848178 RepID=UPI003CECECF4
MKKLLFSVLSLTFLINGANAKDYNVADYGIVPGEDASYKLNLLINKIGDETNATIIFPKGQYNFYPENATEKYRYVANHDNGLKRMAFPLYNAKNVTVDGGGSTFMFHGRIVPFTLESVEGATLKNFSIDFIRSYHAELSIVERNEKDKSFIVEIDPQLYPYKIEAGQILFERFGQWDPIGSNIVFDPKTRSPIFNTNRYSISGLTTLVTKLNEQRLKFENIGKGSPPPIGSVLVVYGVHPTSRLVPGIHITNSSDIHIENVTVLDAGGMALIVERTNNIDLNNFNVTSAEGRYVATRADATHFVGCKGLIKVENSILEHMLDDGINVHGAYVNVDSYLGNKEFIASISHFQQMGLVFGEAGDEIAILSRETVLPFFKTSIKSVREINEKRFVVTLNDVPKNMPSGPLSFENLTWNPDVVIRNNKFRENRARGALITTKGKVLIENNYFNSQMHGILIEGDNKKWYESGAVQDVTIRNNTFDNIGFSGKDAYPLFAAPMLTPQQRIGEGQYHKNITFTGNTIHSFNGLMVHALSVDGLTVADNTIVFSDTYPSIDKYPSIDLHYSKNSKLTDNTAKGFKRPLIVLVSSDSENVIEKNNTGFSDINVSH